MIDYLQIAVAGVMHRISVNQIRPTVHDGLPVFVKRRRPGAIAAVWFGNRFLALAGSPSRMFVRPAAWADWEVNCAALLYPQRPAVQIGPGRAVIVPKISGVSLRQLLHRNDPCVHAFVAAARELRRVHQLACNYYQAAWSHGDLHLDNIMYDPAADQAVLIDFDTRHESTISPTQRHADDLNVMLLELLALPDDRWREPATALVEGYNQGCVLDELGRQLFVPHGFAKILWHTRTNGAATSRIDERLQCLRTIIQQALMPNSASRASQLCRDAG